jgi:hypothetical protein
MYKGVIERGENVGDAEYMFSLRYLGTKGNCVLFLGRLDFLGGLQNNVHPLVSLSIH